MQSVPAMWRRVARSSGYVLFLAWTVVVLATPSEGWALCFEPNGTLHIEAVAADGGDCADKAAGPQGDPAELHKTTAHTHETPHCIGCVDVVIEAGIDGAALAAPPAVLTVPDAAPTATVALPTGLAVANAPPTPLPKQTGILPRPTTVLRV